MALYQKDYYPAEVEQITEIVEEEEPEELEPGLCHTNFNQTIKVLLRLNWKNYSKHRNDLSQKLIRDNS